MKKTAALALFALLLATPVFAETTKDAVNNVGSFWSREAERSGLKESTSSWGKFWQNANPVKFLKEQREAYDARKGGAATK